MRHGILVVCVALLPISSLFAQDEASIDGVRTSLKEWVETRQLTSRLQADWRSEKEMLEQTAALYNKELADLNEKLTKSGTSSTKVGEESAKLELEKQELDAAMVKVAENVTLFEKELRTLAQTFPSPLANKLEPLMKRLPDDPDKARLSPAERMQNLIGILIEVDKFNSSLAVESELQRRPSGEEIQVKTLYVGLGQAYFVDKTGEFSGVGIPSATGWEWKETPGIGERVLRAIAIYENTQPPAFVGLPMNVN